MIPFKNFATDAEGNIAIEMAIFLPVLFLFVITAFDFFRYSLAHRQISTVLSNTAVFLRHSNNRDLANISDFILKELGQHGISLVRAQDLQISISDIKNFQNNPAAQKAVVTINIPYSSLVEGSGLKLFPDMNVSQSILTTVDDN